ncbi:hypothetical protein MMMDOFMJ_3940 [Methylobacterium gnaphalii]|nr:hypothetical protein MMMDOFMJ_3940 [Methylobacterium gnaphalii]
MQRALRTSDGSGPALGLDRKARKRAVRYGYAPNADDPIEIGRFKVFRTDNFPLCGTSNASGAKRKILA